MIITFNCCSIIDNLLLRGLIIVKNCYIKLNCIITNIFIKRYLNLHLCFLVKQKDFFLILSCYIVVLLCSEQRHILLCDNERFQMYVWVTKNLSLQIRKYLKRWDSIKSCSFYPYSLGNYASITFDDIGRPTT